MYIGQSYFLASFKKGWKTHDKFYRLRLSTNQNASFTIVTKGRGSHKAKIPLFLTSQASTQKILQNEK